MNFCSVRVFFIIGTFFLFFLSLSACCGQESSEFDRYGNSYYNEKVKRLENLTRNQEKQMHRLISSLNRKEKRILRRLKKEDSVQYSKIKNSYQSLSFDSLHKVSRKKNAELVRVPDTKNGRLVDSITRLRSFLNEKGVGLRDATGNSKLETTALRSRNQAQVESMVSARLTELKETCGALQNGKSLRGIEKKCFYSNKRMEVINELLERPSDAEQKAVEYLQGVKGFESAMKQPGSEGEVTMDDGLESGGFQTRKMLNSALQERFTSSLASISKSVNTRIGNWTNDLKNVRADGQAAIKEVSKISSATKHNGFRTNEMRCLPLRERLVKQYSFQISSPQKYTPAQLNLLASIGFRQTKRLSYGLGFIIGAGLGRSWNDIRLSIEGVGVKSYIEHELWLGFGLYVGYERFMKQGLSLGATNTSEHAEYFSKHANKRFSESSLLGIFKQYRISSRWDGALHILYDVWWKDKNLRSPIIIRITTKKN